MKKEQTPEPYKADIALLLEGTYPFIRGGVSSWVHQIVTGLPEFTFALVFLGGDRRHYGEQQYRLPDNVRHLECLYLMDTTVAGKPSPRRGNASAFAAQQVLHERFKTCGAVPAGVLHQVFADLGCRHGISREDFLYSEESWEMIDDSYRRYCTEPSFVEYFWSVRSMHTPLFRLAETARTMPRVRMVHSISTGYAGLLGAITSEQRGIPYVISEHGIYTKERKIDLSQAQWIHEPTDPVSGTLDQQAGYIRRLWIRFFEALGRLAYQQSNDIVALYRGNQQRQWQDGADPGRTRIIPNGIDPSRYEAVRAQRPQTIPPVLGLVGRVVPIKDIKTFVRAMRTVCDAIPDAEGWIAGPEDEDVTYVQECKDLVTSLGLDDRVRFLGFQDINQLLPKLGLMVLTSISEALPLVILEAHAAGLPCLATDVGACRELLEGVSEDDRAIGPSGAVVPIADPQATAREAVRLLSDSEAWHRAQRAGLERVQRFYTLDSMFAAYRDIYTSALAQQSGGDSASRDGLPAKPRRDSGCQREPESLTTYLEDS